MSRTLRDLLGRATRHLERAWAHQPHEPEHGVLLGRAYLLAGRTADAIDPLRSALGRDPRPATAFLLGTALLAEGDVDEAKHCAMLALEENGSFAKAWALRAACHLETDARDQALVDLRTAVLLAPATETFVIRLAAELLLEAWSRPPGGSRKECLVETRERLLACRPHEFEPEWRYLLGVALFELEDARMCVAALARTDFPSRAEAAFRRALAQIALGDEAGALASLHEAEEDERLKEPVSALRDPNTRALLAASSTPPPVLEQIPKIDLFVLIPEALRPNEQVERDESKRRLETSANGRIAAPGLAAESGGHS